MIGLAGIGRLGLQPVRPATAFSPAVLFAAGEQGAWYDPTDLSTLFQDSAGTTPVTAVEQPVGLWLDKSKGLVLGSELVTNGDFSVDANWNKGSGWSISDGAARANTSGVAGLGQALSISAGKSYRVQFTATVTSGNISSFLGGASIRSNFTSGTYSIVVVAGAANTLLQFDTLNACVATIDNISVRELPGNHATQSTSLSRPTYSARYNVLNATATLSTQNVTTLAAAYTLRLEGAGSVTLSGTATGTFAAGTHSVTCTAGTLTVTVSGTVNNADLRLTADVAGQPAYQAVTNLTTYDTAGFRPYLRFDGSDDSFGTSSINFSATDKVTAFAGVTRLSDAAAGVLLESGTSIGSVNGSVSLWVPDGASATVAWYSKGTTIVAARRSGIAAPISALLTGLGNIGEPSATLRTNGTQVATNTASQGTGNYGNHQLFIGARSNDSLRYNGRLYGLIVRGAQSTASEIAATETWLNQRTGAY